MESVKICETCKEKDRNKWCEPCLSKELKYLDETMLYIKKALEDDNKISGCGTCGEQYIDFLNERDRWCRPCQIYHFRKERTSSKNEKIDNLIDEMQSKMECLNDMAFEWIPYDQFSNIKEIGKSDFATVYSAKWKDGPSLYYNEDSLDFVKNPNIHVALKYLHNFQNITDEFLNEVRSYRISETIDDIIGIYGISQDPDKKVYIMVLEYTANMGEDCEECVKQYTDHSYIKYNKCCKQCQMNCLDTIRINSENQTIDDFIRKMQLEADNYDIVLEWIPYDQFTNIKEVGKGRFATVDSAIWKNGPLNYIYTKEYKGYCRDVNRNVALKRLNDSQNISEFINEIEAYSTDKMKAGITKVYGISQHPDTKGYIMILEYAKDGNFNEWINEHQLEFCHWNRKLRILCDIIEGLKEIHNNQRFHGDFHSGNILFDDSKVLITDMGLSRKVGDKTGKVYGVMSYTAPEVLKGKSHTQAADIYSFGMMMYLVATGSKPFDNCNHDQELTSKICNGVRPKITEKDAPKCYIDLMEKCWHSNPYDRPSAIEICQLISLFRTSSSHDSFDFQIDYEIRQQFKAFMEKSEIQMYINNDFVKEIASMLLHEHISHCKSSDCNHGDIKFSDTGDIQFSDTGDIQFSDTGDIQFSDTGDIKFSDDIGDIKFSDDIGDIKFSDDIGDIKFSDNISDINDIKLNGDVKSSDDIKFSEFSDEIKFNSDEIDIAMLLQLEQDN